MVRKICLDSDIIIGILNNDEATKIAIKSLDADFYLTSVNVFEVWFGRKNNEPIFELLQRLHPLILDDKSSRLAAEILRELKKRGELIDMKDLFIAAICINNEIELFTYNKKHFERLQKYGLKLA